MTRKVAFGGLGNRNLAIFICLQATELLSARSFHGFSVRSLLCVEDVPLVIVTASDVAEFARPVNLVDCLPQEGRFSRSNDREVACQEFFLDFQFGMYNSR